MKHVFELGMEKMEINKKKMEFNLTYDKMSSKPNYTHYTHVIML